MLPNLSRLGTSTGTHCTDDQTPSPKRVKRDPPHPREQTPIVGVVRRVAGPDGDSNLGRTSVVCVGDGDDAGDWAFLNHQDQNLYGGLGSQYAYSVYLVNDTTEDLPMRILEYENHSAPGISEDGRDVFEQEERVKFVPLVRERINKDNDGAVKVVDFYQPDDRTLPSWTIPTHTKGIAVTVSREDGSDRPAHNPDFPPFSTVSFV